MKSKILVFLLFFTIPAFAQDVTILPLTGGIETAQISPGDGSATAYRMDLRGQKAICFQSAATTDVYVSSSATVGTSGWGLYNQGDNICMDLASGTTVYFWGDGAGGDIRAIIAK